MFELPNSLEEEWELLVGSRAHVEPSPSRRLTDKSSQPVGIALELRHGNVRLAVTSVSSAWLWLLSKNFTISSLKSVIQPRNERYMLETLIEVVNYVWK